MSRLNDLLYQLRAKEPELAKDLEREVTALAERRAFGLNFERHVPEAVELPGRKVRKGDKVRILPPRGEMPTKADDRLWRVLAFDRPAVFASLEPLERPTDGELNLETTSAALEDLVVVAEFRDPIYPGLESTGTVERGGDKPFHTVINAENFHAVETLLFTHRGKADAIYIDPPYNTGARDWKYNNDYVEGDDLYRHSKWLAFMERRLLLAKELLNPDKSVLIVTIDAREQARLALLLEQVFPECVVQMASIVINPSGAGNDGINRVDEYAFFVSVGKLNNPASRDDMLNDDAAPNSRIKGGLSWESFLRSGTTWYRSERPNLCYPILIDPATMRIVGTASPFSGDDESSRPNSMDGYFAAWPVRTNGQLGIWRTEAEKLESLAANGYAYVSAADQKRGTYSIKYLLSGTIDLIEAGQAKVERTGHRGQVVAAETSTIDKIAKSVWFRPAHNAGKHGSDLLRALVPGRSFPYPKSLYAVEDCLRICIGENLDALVVDFFAGSGTTAHAVMRLNKQDGGNRQSISVTNNEVAADEQKALREKGLRPGDSGWEQWGICEHITKPRIEAAITGRTPEGQAVKGDYKFTDEFPMAEGFEENVEFFTLTYEAPLRLASNREFEKIAPLLWMRAGSRGRRIDEVSKGWDVADVYGVLADLDKTEDFLKKVAAGGDDIALAFIVTDEDRLFESVARELPEHVEPVRLYEAYLRNFEIESGRGAL